MHKLTRAYLDDSAFATVDAEEPLDDAEEGKEGGAGEIADKDNRDIVDNNTAQKLTQVEIEALKKSGMTGGELIKHIVENSESWNKRTKFSQEKYLKKKMQKYAVTFEVKRPTALELCEAYT